MRALSKAVGKAVILMTALLLPFGRTQDVGRLLMLSFDGKVAPLEQLKTLRPAGFIFFPSNVGSTRETRRATQRLQAASDYPLLFGVDQEGGTILSYRTAEATLFPGNMALGAVGDPQWARRIGKALGEELAYAGFNLNFAPVSDVASNSDNPIVGTRSFGSEPAAVGQLAVAFSKGLAQAGVSAAAKHFPGHGATAVDSHRSLPTVRHTRAELSRLELPPFRALIGAGVPAIMSAHVAYPALDSEIAGDSLPATLSKPILTDLLRRGLGFRGVVMSDALNMRAITDRYGPGEAAVRSVLAGVDLLLVVASREVQGEVYRALQDALASGRLSRARVRQANARTARLAHLYRRPGVKETGVQETGVKRPDYAAHARLAETVAQRAATLLWNDGVLPIRASQQVVVVAPEPGGYGEASHLGSAFKAVRGGVRSVLLSDDPTPAEREEAVSKAKTADVVVLASYHGFGVFPPGFAVLEAELAALDTPLVVVALGRPDDLRFFTARPAAYAAVYGYRDANLRAATALLLGKRLPTGRLPVRAGAFARGAGMTGWQ